MGRRLTGTRGVKGLRNGSCAAQQKHGLAGLRGTNLTGVAGARAINSFNSIIRLRQRAKFKWFTRWLHGCTSCRW